MSNTESPQNAGSNSRVLAWMESSFGSVTHIQLGLAVSVILALVAAPLWAEPYLYILSLASIWAILAMGWDIISGHTGYMSFGHSALSGSAAYATALLVIHVDPGLPMAVTLIVSVAVAFVVGMLFALPSLRLSGPYFSLLTLLMVLLLYRLVNPFSEYTGGELGLRVPRLADDLVVRYYMTLLPMFVIAAVLFYVSRSDIGTVFMGIKSNEHIVEDAGIDTTKFKLGAFGLSAITMGIGGALLAHFYGYVDPSTVLVIDRSIEMIVIAAIGGMGSVIGPALGAYLFVYLREEFLLYTLRLDSTQRWIVLWLTTGGIIFYSRNGLFIPFWRWLGQFETLRGVIHGAGAWIRGLPTRLSVSVRRSVADASIAARLRQLTTRSERGER